MTNRAAVRENARRTDGKFGEEARAESDTPLATNPQPLAVAIAEFDQAVNTNRARPWGVNPSEESMDATVLSVRNLADNAGPSPLVEHLRHDVEVYENLGSHHPVAFKTLLVRALRVRKDIGRSHRSN